MVEDLPPPAVELHCDTRNAQVIVVDRFIIDHAVLYSLDHAAFVSRIEICLDEHPRSALAGFYVLVCQVVQDIPGEAEAAQLGFYLRRPGVAGDLHRLPLHRITVKEQSAAYYPRGHGRKQGDDQRPVGYAHGGGANRISRLVQLPRELKQAAYDEHIGKNQGDEDYPAGILRRGEQAHERVPDYHCRSAARVGGEPRLYLNGSEALPK